MTLRISEKVPPHLQRLAQRLDVQIKTLEAGGDTKSVFDQDEQRALQTLGTEKYLAYLTRTRKGLGQLESLSEE
ncbi:MAG: hypothetical protein HYY52_05060 [Candidatus Melainabacteria bacterium]|nr:hypothetical protein [Candidatus Melainabacteria bacterium]